MPDEVLGVETGAEREAPEEVLRARARRLEPGMDTGLQLRHGRRPHVRADERIFQRLPGLRRAAGMVMAPVAAVTVELDAPVEALLQIEPGVVVHLRRARLEVAVVEPVGARLALGLVRHPEKIEAGAARPLEQRGIHPVIPDVEEADLGGGPGERSSDADRIGTVAQWGDVDNGYFAGVDGFGSGMRGHRWTSDSPDGHATTPPPTARRPGPMRRTPR